MSKRPGRPLKGSAKRESLLIRIEPTEKDTFLAAAGVAGISLSAWARERLRMAAVRDLEGVGLEIPFLKRHRRTEDGG